MAEGKKKTRRPWIEWTPEQDAEIMEAYANKEDVGRLAAKYGLERHNIYRRADVLGVRGGNYFTTKEIKMLEELFPQKIQMSEIARIMDRSKKSIYIKANELGLRRPGNQRLYRYTDEVEAEIVRMYVNELKSMHKIQIRFKSSHAVIKRILKKNGVKLRSKKEENRVKNWETLPIIPFPELYTLYFVECWSHAKIERQYSITRKALQFNLDHHGIQRRTVAERKAMLEEFKDRERTFKDNPKE